MRMITLGSTGITVPANAFGALPVQRTDTETAIRLLRKAYHGGMTFFDTARAYSDSEYKLGLAFEGIDRDTYYIATKTQATDPETFREHLEESLRLLKTDHVDIYQFHCAGRCFRPGDGTGMYEEMLRAKEEGKIRHIGITTHKIGVAEEAIQSGLYETLQFPFSYLASERECALVKACEAANMGFIAMKGLCGGILTDSRACMAFMSHWPVLPIWGIQRENELDEWLRFFSEEPCDTPETEAVIAADRKELATDFCRGCGYCEPCTAGIIIHDCARMSPMIRRSPSARFLSEYWQKEMERIDDCVNCGLCESRCPYGLDTPQLLKRNLADYRNIVSGKTKV